ncbi:acyl transferase/acyl hydrolase/lysophospholipase [Rhypophila decipiens]|uniref:Acyl transferase/acyl hydrolase/lysophospholipase n=1 Tax=Rhypophila decipiens TaxID=261697 RepID=A0AAN7B4J2_9PEZI|nr:acyl transferase/acyl hydrolase/lysophospholipase [Rhypophila decipiens]
MAAVPQDMVVFESGQTSTQPEAAMAGPSHVGTDQRQHRCLLSLDGGGVRGLSALIILNNIMLQVNIERKKKRRELELKPCDVFDLIGGTSTGGLIAIMLGRLRMDVESCLKRYYQFIPDVFQVRASNPLRAPITLLGIIRPLYDSKRLEKFILDTVAAREGKVDGEGKPDRKLAAKVFLQEARPDCRVFVCATAGEDSSTSLLRNYLNTSHTEAVHPTIAQAALATTAAPTFFYEAKIPIVGTEGKNLKFLRFVDGALKANNPVEQVKKEADVLWPKPEQPEGSGPTQYFVDCLVSIGTGVGQPQETSSGVSQFLKALVKIATETEDTATDFRDRWDLNLEERPDSKSKYFRFSVVRGLNTMAIDAQNPEAKVNTLTLSYVKDKKVKKSIDECAAMLTNKPLNPDGVVSLIETGQSALKKEQFTIAFKKFFQADELVHRHNPDKLDKARYVAVNLGMAESWIGMAEAELGQEDADIEAIRSIGKLLEGACNRIEYAKKPEKPSMTEQDPNMNAQRDVISRLGGTIEGARRELEQVVRDLRTEIKLIRRID